MSSLNPMNNINSQMWYKNTKPYWPSHVINCFKIKIRLCHLGFRREIGIPLGKQLDLRETMKKIHGDILHFGIFKPLFSFLWESCHPGYEVFCDFQLDIPDLGSKPIKCLHKGLCDHKVVTFEFPEEDIPTVSLQIVYGIIVGKKGLAAIRFDSNHRGHGHYEIDTIDITGGRLRLPINE
jgi:hypothetical protein